jgi:hypothetical protein
MEQFLKDYIVRLTPFYKSIPGKTGHEIASAFLAFRFGIYANAINECTIALSLVPGDARKNSDAVLRKALQIIKANADDLNNSKVDADLRSSFSNAERAFVAVKLPPEQVEDPGTLELDNALVLVYAVAVIASPDDEQALDEHRKYVTKILSAYKRALGLV